MSLARRSWRPQSETTDDLVHLNLLSGWDITLKRLNSSSGIGQWSQTSPRFSYSAGWRPEKTGRTPILPLSAEGLMNTLLIYLLLPPPPPKHLQIITVTPPGWLVSQCSAALKLVKSRQGQTSPWSKSTSLKVRRISHSYYSDLHVLKIDIIIWLHSHSKRELEMNRGVRPV